MWQCHWRYTELILTTTQDYEGVQEELMKEQLLEKMLSGYLLRIYLEFSNRAQQSNSKTLKIRKIVLPAG